MVKLIVSDMDGTLLNQKERVSTENREALWTAYKKGIHIAICSGRGPENIRKIMVADQLPPCYALGYNGGHCFDEEGKELFSGYMKNHPLKACIEIFNEENVIFAAMWAKGIAMNRSPEDVASQNRLAFAQAQKSWKKSTWDSATFTQAINQGIYKLLYIDSSLERLGKIKKKIEKIEEVSLMSSWYNNIELMPKGINKGTATAMLAERLNLSSADVMTLGDQENDTEMIAFAGTSVAMGNATEKIKEIAKYTTAHHENHGVALAIQKYAL